MIYEEDIFYRDYWKHDESDNIEFLNSIPSSKLTDVIHKGMTIEEIESAIKSEFDEEYAYTHEGKYLFDALSLEELEDYLTWRFRMGFADISTRVLV